MALKDTCKTLRTLLEGVHGDLEKAEAGNKAAAQRVRTQTIKLEKVAKLYRKESIKAEKTGGGKKPKKAAAKKAPAKGKASKAPAAHPKPAAKKPSKPAAKAPAKKVATARKKPTAKVPRGKK